MEYMPKSLARWLAAIAETSPQKEICGFIMPDWTFIQINNVSRSPSNSFVFDSLEQTLVLAKGVEPVGIFHSHPGGTRYLSDQDLDGWPGNLQVGFCRYWVIGHNWVCEYDKMYEWEDQEVIEVDPIVIWEHSW